MDWKSLSISIRCQFSPKLSYRFNAVVTKVITIMGGVWWMCGTCTAPLLWYMTNHMRSQCLKMTAMSTLLRHLQFGLNSVGTSSFCSMKHSSIWDCLKERLELFEDLLSHMFST